MRNKIQQVITGYMADPVIMEFVINEALEKVTSEIKAKIPGSEITTKGVLLSSHCRPKIAERINQYVASGLMGCYLASLKVSQE